MSNKNFLHSWQDTIQRIRENLGEGRYARTDGIFPILKELVQNAEDASARKLVIAWTAGLPDAIHPLLRGPALVAINDGEFHKVNGEAIRKMGLSSKPADASSIGKFGLGMKSVFHLSEVFMFVSMGDGGKLIDADVLSPWSADSDGLHPEWDGFEPADIGRIADHVKTLAWDTRWFCLWLPLRRRCDLNGIDPIEPSFPGELAQDELLGPSQAQRLSVLMPMLSHLLRIEFRMGTSSGEVFTEVCDADQSARRTSLTQFANLPLGKPRPFKGEVNSCVDSKLHHSIYAGIEFRPNDDRLQTLAENGAWPKRFAPDKATGRTKDFPEKAHSHSALCFTASRCLAKDARLGLHWSVFLPLGTSDELPLTGCDWSIDLFLHGWFFPNSGRTEVEGLRDECPPLDCIPDSSSVRRAWNHCLARCGTLPLIPAALAQFVEHSKWDSKVTVAVTHTLQYSPLFRRFRGDICRDASWLHRLASDSRLLWQTVPSTSDYFEFPELGDATNLNLLFKALPSLREQLERRVVVPRGEPRLTAAEPSRWTTESIRELLLTAVPKAIFASEALLSWLTTLLDDCAQQDVWKQLGFELAGVARGGLPVVVVDRSVRLIAATRRFLTRIPPTLRVNLARTIGNDASARELFDLVCQQPAEVVWIPEDCAPENSQSSGTVSAKQAEVVLKALAAWGQRQLSNPARDTLGEFAAHMIRATSEIQELLRLAGSLELFSGTDCQKQEERRLSWKDIVEHQRLSALFTKPIAMARQLQDALADESILLISVDLARLLFGPDHEATKQCREGQLLAALSAIPKPRLTGPTHRRKLLETLLGYIGGRGTAQFKDCIRYVLHGVRERYGVAEPLLVRSSGSSDIWRRVTSIALKALGQEWRLLDSAFASVLSEDDHREFGIDVIGPHATITLARELISNNGSFADFNSLRPTGDEYRELLHQIEDVKLCQRLPIHADLTGEFVSINEHRFWQSDWVVPEGLAATVCLLKLSEDDATRKRQLQLAHPLDAIRLVGIVLDQPTPSTFWQILLDALGALDSIPSDLLTKLSSAIWMPTTSAGFIKPEDVIHLPELRDGVSRLTAAHPGVYFDPESLAKDFRQHPAFDRILLHVVLPRARALEMLGTLLQEDKRNLVGGIDVSFEDWLESFRAADTELFPQISLLRAIAETFPGTAHRTFDELRQPIGEQRVHELLAFLRVEHERDRSKSRQERLLCTYGKYLSTLLTPETFEERLRKMQLPTRDGTWHVAEELCCDNDGVALSAVITSAIEIALVPFFGEGRDVVVTSVNPRGPMTAIANVKSWNFVAATERLRDYFDSWRDVIPNEQIGGFMALLGDEPTLRDLAQQFLGRNRTVETTREKFGLLVMPAGGHLEDGPTMISKQRVVVEVVHEPTVLVLNLFGRPIEVPRNERPATLFVGYGNRANPFPHKVVDGLRVRCFRLNAINPRDFAEVELSRLLRDSAVKFIGEAYNSYEHQTRFAATWDELAESDQLDIRITQLRIIEHGFLILDQYGLRSDPHVSKVLDQWDAAERLKAERETQGEGSSRHSQRNPDRELQLARAELRKLLESAEHRETQQRILEAVRHRIRDYYQYELHSIPFELFQNADDAYAELSQFFPLSDKQHQTNDLPTVILRRDGNRLAFAHFGRRINQYPVGGNQSSRGFDNDLWKMSVLSLSNKGHAVDGPQTAVTGKFGLGFKSVFYACDRPRLLSGRLAFEFVGGVYPRRLIGEERHSLDEVRSSAAAGDVMATIIEMEMRDGVESLDVIDRFSRLAHLLVVFGRRVRCCRLSEEGKADEEVRWEQPDDVPHNPGVQAGTVRPLRSVVPNATTSNVLLFKSEAGSLLFRLGARKFERFADQAPTVWVTAPTEEQLDLGFLVNGPFSLDVGRAQLARDPRQNEIAARRLGKQFGEQLEQLFETSQSPGRWNEVRKSLQLAADTASFEFWDSLWDLVVIAVAKGTTRDEPADQLVRDILWNTPDQGAAGFYARKRAVPARLPGSHFEREMVSLNKVRYSVRGFLAQDDGYALACVRTWPKFREKVGDSQLVSDEKVVSPLRDRELCSTLVTHISPIGVADVISWELIHRMVGVVEANRFGDLIDKQRLTSLKDDAERNRLSELLEATEFLASDERYHPASRLLIGHRPTGTPEGKFHDERRRAAFAPRDRVLNPNYGVTGVEFFVACREKMDASPRDMAAWVVAATDPAIQKAALDYLATGELGQSAQQELKQRGLEGTWLEHLSEHPVFQSMAIVEKGKLFALLPQAIAENIEKEAIQNSQEIQRQWTGRSAASILADMSDWWQEERPWRLPEYERTTYPNGDLSYLADDSHQNAQRRRKDWVTLFLIGMTHTMGRTVATQHRGFLRKCDQEGWLDMIAGSERDPVRWMQWIDEFLNRQFDDSKFLQWMKQFVGIYQVSRHLDDYVEAFLAVDRIQRPFALTEVTNTRTSALFQRGGVDATPLSRVLGMGQCFIMRELVRMNVISDRNAHRHCYVPTARVRRLLQLLGCEALDTPSRRWELSPLIHRFLSQHLPGDTAPFFPDFDIPLQIIAEDSLLMAKFFTTEVQFDGDDEPDPWDGDEANAESTEAT